MRKQTCHMGHTHFTILEICHPRYMPQALTNGRSAGDADEANRPHGSHTFHHLRDLRSKIYVVDPNKWQKCRATWVPYILPSQAFAIQDICSSLQYFLPNEIWSFNCLSRGPPQMANEYLLLWHDRWLVGRMCRWPSLWLRESQLWFLQAPSGEPSSQWKTWAIGLLPQRKRLAIGSINGAFSQT